MFFKNVKNLNELKVEYKKLCKVHHPDLGGDVETMKRLNCEYEKMLSSVINKDDNFDNNLKIEKDLMVVIQKIIALKGLCIEICGRWIWITGETYTHKSFLKDCKFFWAKKKRLGIGGQIRIKVLHEKDCHLKR